MIGQPCISSTGARSSDELQWLDSKTGHQDDSPCDDNQGDMPYCVQSAVAGDFSFQGHSPPFKDGTTKQDKDKHKHDKKHKDGSSRFSGRDHHGAVPVACPVAPAVPYIDPPAVPPPPPDRQISQQQVSLL